MDQSTPPGTPKPGFTPLQKVGLGLMVPAVAGAAYLGWRIRSLTILGDQAADRGARYDDAVLRDIDLALFKWQKVSSIETNLQSVHSFALLSDGRIAVAGERLVRLLRADGTMERDIPLTAAPQTITASAEGLLFVGLKDHVEIFTPDGQKVEAWNPLPAGAFITCIALHGEDVYVADAGRRVVLHTDRHGKLLGELGRADESKHVRGLVVPSPHLDVAIAADGAVWVNNPGRHSLEAYNANGEVTTLWGQYGTTIDTFAGCCNPTDFTIFSDGRFAVAEKGIPRVKVYSKDGKFESVVAGPESFAADAAGMDLAVDPQGRILVLDPVAHALRVFVAK